MSLSMLRSRKGAHPIMALVITAVVIFIGVAVVMNIVNSITLPCMQIGDSITLTNATQANLNYPYLCLFSNVHNATDALPQETNAVPIGCNYTNTAITCYFNDTYQAGTWTVDYTYNLQQGNDTYAATRTTFWNSISLGAVSLITLAASLVLGSFFFK